MNMRWIWAIAAPVALAACHQAPAATAPLAGAAIGGPFALVDGAGRTVTDRSFEGQWRIMYFGYTFCPDVCPTDAQNIGAGLWDRVGRITRAGILYNVALTGTMVVAVLWFDRTVLCLFLGQGSEAIPIASRIGLIATWSFVFFGATMVLFGTVRANGAVWGPLLILVVALLPVRLGIAALLRPALGIDALWWSFPVSSFVNLAGAILYYCYGPWRGGRLLAQPEDACDEQAQGIAEPAGMLRPAK